MPPHGNAATTAAGHIGPALHITHFNSFPASRLFVYRVNIPCLSLWERWPSAARTERVNKKDCKALSVTCGDSSPKGRAKGLYPVT